MKCLTANGEEYELSDEAQKILCLTDEGIVYISASHEKSYWVLAFLDKLRRSEVIHRIKLSSIEEIAMLYKNGGVQIAETTSSRQDEVIALILSAVKDRASDVHIIVREGVTEIKHRVDGELKHIAEMPESDGNDICATIYQSMCDVAEPVFNPRRGQDARLMVHALAKCGLYGGRIATRPTDSGLLMVIRLLYDRGGKDLLMEDLGYTKSQIRLINRMASRRFGINILSGPTGSGKSTTLECVLKRIIAQDKGKSNIITLEDPPEYKITGAVQTPILCDKDDDDAISREWARAISNAMRLDPDIMMCGEIRDISSATATFRAAMTGHGVWTTVHANDALAILTRLQDIGVSTEILGDATLVTGLINQVLTRKLCPHCKEPYVEHVHEFEEEVRVRIDEACETSGIYVRGKGCNHCNFTGGKGRTVVAEVIEPNSKIMELFMREGKMAARRYWARELGGLTKNKILIDLVNRGVVDPRDGESDVCMLDDDKLLGV
jgi:type II secretory ATPase GspE/PulE/Tfp pilus assembly ATPase PilB-like protein